MPRGRLLVALGLGALGLGACDPSSGSEAELGPEPAPTVARGEIVFLEEHGPPDFRIAALDLETGAIETLFTLPSGAFAYELAVHPSTGRVLLAYTEPAQGDEPGFDRSVLVELHDDGPRYVLGEDEAGHWALWPQWSADGASIWYVAQRPRASEDDPPHTLVKADAQGGRIELEIPWATEPAVSPDGLYVAWVAVDPVTWRRSVVLATADGEPVRTMVHDDDVYDLGLPVFSSDGAGVFVSVLADPMATMRSAQLQASPRATAHGVHLLPADWYGVAIDGTELRPAGTLATVVYDGAVSSAEPILVAATREGIDVVDLADGRVERMLSNRAIRSVAWREGD